MHKIISRFTLWAAASLLGVSAMAQTEIHKYQPDIRGRHNLLSA